MFCSQCGTLMDPDAQFCSRCGNKKIEINVTDVETHVFVEEMNSSLRTKIKLLWLLPILVFCLMGSSLFLYYKYEENVTKEVEKMRSQAEKLVLEGQLQKASALVAEGLSIRPNHKILQYDQMLIKEGLQIEKQLKQYKNHSKKQEFSKALKVIDDLEKKMENGKGSFYEMFSKRIKDQKVAISVAKIKYEMQDKNSIEELAPLLVKLSSYTIPEAKEASSQIRKQIAEISYTNANNSLKKKDFSIALETVKKGLEYDSCNTKLLSFKDTVVKQKKAFEDAEQARIEQAMVVAAKENQLNTTKAVDVLAVNGVLNEEGDFVITGSVQNIGTRPISMIEIFYTIYDENWNVLGASSTYVYPNYLAPNETGTFESSHYGLYSGTHVEVTRTTWYIN